MPELAEIQAIGDAITPVNQSPTKADEQCRLIQVVDAMARSLSLYQSPKAEGLPADPHARA